MPFINCSNCNKPYSAKSQKCPHCGAENTEYNSPKPQIEVADDIPQNHNEDIHDINEFPYKYCQGCGKKLHIEAKVCPNCGYQIEMPNQSSEEDKPSFGLNAIGVLIPIIGLILYAVIVHKYPKKAESLIGWVITGVITNILFGGLLFFMYGGLLLFIFR